jgi:putative transposase
MSRVVSPSTNRAYGVAMVSRLWRITRATVYRHRSPLTKPRRPGPVGPMPDAELVDAIRDLLARRSGPDFGSPASARPSEGSCA